MRRLLVLAVVCAAAPAYADRVVALAPLSSLGTEDKSAATKQLTLAIEQALGAVQGTKVIGAAQVSAAVDKAKKPQLKTCEEDVSCTAELGKLVGAQIVVTGSVGGLGDSKVIYLGATDVATAKVLRSTTLAVGAKDTDATGPAGAAVRLLDPDRYKGTVHLAFDVSGASVFVNGSKVTPTGKGELALPVGTQAIRITHPEFHDFVRFVDVTYGKTTDVQVDMKQYPIIEKNVKGLPTSRDKVIYEDPPVWRRWYVVGPAVIVLGIVAGAIVHKTDFPAGQCRIVGMGSGSC
jgi:hypothetical protein